MGWSGIFFGVKDMGECWEMLGVVVVIGKVWAWGRPGALCRVDVNFKILFGDRQ